VGAKTDAEARQVGSWNDTFQYCKCVVPVQALTCMTAKGVVYVYTGMHYRTPGVLMMVHAFEGLFLYIMYLPAFQLLLPLYPNRLNMRGTG